MRRRTESSPLGEQVEIFDKGEILLGIAPFFHYCEAVFNRHRLLSRLERDDGPGWGFSLDCLDSQDVGWMQAVHSTISQQLFFLVGRKDDA